MDSKFVPEFDRILKEEGIEVIKVGPRKPNLNSYAERFVQSAKSECLSPFMLFGEVHLRHLLSVWQAHYHRERPHQGLDNCTPSGFAPPPVSDIAPDEVECHERLGGLLKSCHRRAA